MKRLQVHFLALLILPACPDIAGAVERPRLAVLTDIGGDPDDTQSMIRLMVYASEFEIEALASASGTRGELKEAVTRPDLIRKIVEAYGKARPKLMRHAENWPTTERLLGVIKPGNRFREREHIGEGHDGRIAIFDQARGARDAGKAVEHSDLGRAN